MGHPCALLPALPPKWQAWVTRARLVIPTQTGIQAAAGHFAYLDPPYRRLSKTPRDFGALDRSGCQLTLSNSDTDLIGELYAGYEQVPARAALVGLGRWGCPSAAAT